MEEETKQRIEQSVKIRVEEMCRSDWFLGEVRYRVAIFEIVTKLRSAGEATDRERERRDQSDGSESNINSTCTGHRTST